MDPEQEATASTKAPAKKAAKPRAPRKKKEPVIKKEAGGPSVEGEGKVVEGEAGATKTIKKGKGAAGGAGPKKRASAAGGARQSKQAKKNAAEAEDDADEEIVGIPLAANGAAGSGANAANDQASASSSAADLAPGDNPTAAANQAGAVGGAGTAAPANEEDEEELDDDVVAKPSQTIGREETKALLDTFDDVTLSRYEVFRRAHLTKASMKKIVTSLVGPVPASVAIVVSGVGKVFVGEMVESALEIMDERGESGPIAPVHLREAFRRLVASRLLDFFPKHKHDCNYPSTRATKNTKKRVVGVLLGQQTGNQVNVANSYAVPFEEDEKDPSVWFLDHNYHEAMYDMFRKVNANEKMVGWYHSGPKLRASDLQINELFKAYNPNPVLVIIDVKPTDIGLPTDAYYAVDEVHDDGTATTRTFNHIPSVIEAEEAEEIGVEHLLRDIKNTNVGSLSTQITNQLHSLKGLNQHLLDIKSYLDKVLAGTLPVNHAIIYNLQDMFNLLPNLQVTETVKSFAVKTNDELLVIYVSSMIRAVIALHGLIENKGMLRDAEGLGEASPVIAPAAEVKSEGDKEKK